MLRIIFNAMRIAVRTTRRFTAFTIIYAILIMWIGITLRSGSLGASFDGWFSIIAGAIVAILYAFLLSHFRRDDIATLKCIGWSNNDIRWLILGEIVMVTLTAFLAILEISWHIFGINFWYQAAFLSNPFVLPYDAFVEFWIIPFPTLFLTLAVLILAQVPGVLITSWRILSISPMRALRRTE